MHSIFRISRPGRESITDVDSVKAVEGAIRDGEPGRYHLHEISAEPLSSGHTSRRWGTAIQRLDGRWPLTWIRCRTDDSLLRPDRRAGRSMTVSVRGFEPTVYSGSRAKNQPGPG